MSSSPLLLAYGLTYSYASREVLRGATLEIEQPGVIAVLGPNGSGKSTLLRLLSGILPWKRASDASGGIRYRGSDCLRMSQGERARHFAYLPPEIRAEFPMTALEAVRLGRTCHGGSSREGDRAVMEAMELTGSLRLMGRDLQELSGGEKQLVALARAIAQGSRILLLDEALSRMDLDHQALSGRLLQRLACERGLLVLTVSHDLNLASEWADRCLLLKDGAIAAFGPTAEVITAERISALYPGSALVVGKNPATGAPKVFFSS